MRAFVVKLVELFKLNTDKPESNFSDTKHILQIPLYQREFKWEDDKIEALISDIRKRDKFLGNIILNESQNSYEIVDGQQRITTCYLLLVFLYNHYQGLELEQESILNLLKPYGDFVLQNDTIGTYLYENGNNIDICISSENDIYFQRDDFDRAYGTIQRSLSDLSSFEDAREFKKKLLDSEILVLINDQQPNTPIEQIFLDINEKAQLLDIEDIFKGHCFEIFVPEFYDQLRNTWIALKKCASGFKPLGVKSLSDYLYWFLLEYDNRALPKKLNLNGRHYLEGKTMDETNELLLSMIKYGESILLFYQNVKESTYRFTDLCPDSFEHRNTRDHIALKAMSLSIIEPAKPFYQKMPFLYFIYRLTEDAALKSSINHYDFRKIISNLYIYASIFIYSSEKKTKADIDHSVRDGLNSSDNQISKVVLAAKALRANAVSGYSLPAKAKFDELAIIYSITDNYDANSNWLSLIYSRDEGYNLEHFIIPNIRSAKIDWCNGEQHQKIELDIDAAKARKTETINYLIIDSALNESLNNYDVITKIDTIRTWYDNRSLDMPKHIQVIVSHIEGLPEYQKLKRCKTDNSSLDMIQSTYNEFLDTYFSDDIQSQLLTKINTAISNSFRN